MSDIYSRDIERAVIILKGGGLVAIPTETVYGLAALARNKKAVEKVFAVKNRPSNHPLIVHVSTLQQAHEWAHFDERADLLAQYFWPGPLTLLLKKKDIVPNWVTGGRDTVALRMPDHVLTLELIDSLGEPIVAPSANRFGKVSPTEAHHVYADLGSDVDLILDGGRCTIGLESTIVECISQLHILRPGAITQQNIEDVLVETVEDDAGPSRASGMLKSHYAPRARVVLCESQDEARALETSNEMKNKKVRRIEEADLGRFAQSLYSLLRQADSDDCEIIIVVKPPHSGLGIAINDRLAKAAAVDTED